MLFSVLKRMAITGLIVLFSFTANISKADSKGEMLQHVILPCKQIIGDQVFKINRDAVMKEYLNKDYTSYGMLLCRGQYDCQIQKRNALEYQLSECVEKYSAKY